MNQTGKLVRLLPEFLAVGHFLERVPLDPVADQLGHMFDKLQITALGIGCRIGTLEDFDQANGLLGGLQGCRYQQESSRVAFPLRERTRHGRNQFPSALHDQPGQEPSVLDGLLVLGIDQVRGNLYLMGEPQTGIAVEEPDGPPHCG